MIKIKLNQE